MNEFNTLPSLDKIKQQAKALRTELEATGTPTSHSRSLELLAHQHGYKDWNSCHAALGNGSVSCPVSLGQQVSGTYLGQSFNGEITGIQSMTASECYRITLVFDEAVDVVKFEGMSNFRKQVHCVIGADGKTLEKTSDGHPQLSLA